MSLGYGVGDFIAVGTLAWNVYKSCKGAPESFGNISSEVLSLHAVLKEAEETVFAQPLSPQKQERFKPVGDGCRRVLEDLDQLIKRYESLGTQGKRTWDRMKWGTEDIAELRLRMISNTGLLSMWINTSQANVEKKLDALLREFRAGRREGSAISTHTVESLCAEDKEIWRTIRKELEEIGLSVAAFNANKNFIISWVSNAVASGAFEEQLSDADSISEPRELSLVGQSTDVEGTASNESPVRAQGEGLVPQPAIPLDRYLPPPGYAYAELLTGVTVRVTFIAPKFLRWAPGQHFWICIPSISNFQSRPFGCASICDEQAPGDAGRALVFLIRAKGGWTKQLWEKVVHLTTLGQLHDPDECPPIVTQPPARGVLLRMFVDGPFGRVARARWEDHSTILIVVGGTGVGFGLPLLIYTCMCMSGRDGKYLGGHSGGWGMKGYRPTRVRLLWIVREFAHIVWCATAIRRCLDMIPGFRLQIDIFVIRFKRISDKEAPPPPPPPFTSPSTPTLNLPTDDYSVTASEIGTLSSPVSKYARRQGQSSRGNEDPDVYQQNYILDLTNFEGENDRVIPGEDAFNRHVMKVGKARRAETRRAEMGEAPSPPLPSKLEVRGRPGWPGHSQELSGEILSPGSYDGLRRSASASDFDLPSGSGSTPRGGSGSRSGNRSVSPTTVLMQHGPPEPPMMHRTLSDTLLDVHDPMIRVASPYAHEFGLTGGGANLRDLVTDCEDNVRLDVDNLEMDDVTVVSEYARPGKPKLDLILADEVEVATGSVIVAGCGPTSMIAILKKAVAAQINPSRIRRGDMRGSITLITEDWAPSLAKISNLYRGLAMSKKD